MLLAAARQVQYTPNALSELHKVQKNKSMRYVDSRPQMHTAGQAAIELVQGDLTMTMIDGLVPITSKFLVT